jgi:flagellar hook assembly protein FlgD
VRIGYRLKKSGRVTITIYDYAMEKVRVIVRNAPRQGGIARSESISEDRWDGRDSGGHLVSVGTYYIHVVSDQGEAAFGKVICVRGRR